jgi:hypothetical protein
MFKDSLRKDYKKQLDIRIAKTGIQKSRLKLFYSKFLIKNPLENKKLQIFHLIVACCFYIDFFMTGFIISNYEFLTSHEKNDTFLDLSVFLNEHDTTLVRGQSKINDFMDHENIYSYIIFIQFVDICMNFLIMKT